ncbi:MAG: DUF108 domain-containing protein, partial [Candidatus Omnitrophica bacterium]|nr:DUF108 domain-containing protein [Candidatus Omnitrophota bacterium]
MKKIGIIGCGAIGSQLARVIQREFKEKARLLALCDLDGEKAKRLSNKLSPSVSVCSIPELIQKSDLIIEAASAQIAAEVTESCLEEEKDVMIMSSGGLIGREEILELAEQRKSHLYIPSGALAGLDAAKAAGLGKIFSAVLITRKPPQGLQGAPYILKNRIDLSNIKEETIIFEGDVEKAKDAFPRNINVAASFKLALNCQKISVKIITSPQFKTNSHQ